MIIHNCIQGSPEWVALRCGIPTASCFDRVITPAKAARSSQLEKYAMELVAERMIGQPITKIQTSWMAEGIDREPQAVAAYEFEHGVEAQAVGFITTDDGRIGASPDRIIPGVRLLEAKSPQVHTHIGYMLGHGPEADYRCQLQGQLYVCEMARVDIVSFYPRLPNVTVRVDRDEKFITELEKHLGELCGLVDEYMIRLAQMGYKPHSEPKIEEIPDWLNVSEADVKEIWAGREQA